MEASEDRGPDFEDLWEGFSPLTWCQKSSPRSWSTQLRILMYEQQVQCWVWLYHVVSWSFKFISDNEFILQSIGVSGPVGNEDLSKKKKKDPNRLKKPKSAFLLWCKEHRQTVCAYYCRLPLFFLKISKGRQQIEVLGYSINWNLYCCYAWNISNSFVLRFF